MDTFLNFHHARSDEQRAKMERIKEEGVCPLCEEYLKKYHDAPIERQTQWWSVAKNDFPYDGSSTHYLVIARTHITRLEEVTPNAWGDLGLLLAEYTRTLEGGSLFVRFGNTDFTGGSIEHLHAHILQGGARTENGEKLKVSLGYKKKVAPRV